MSQWLSLESESIYRFLLKRSTNGKHSLQPKVHGSLLEEFPHLDIHELGKCLHELVEKKCISCTSWGHQPFRPLKMLQVAPVHGEISPAEQIMADLALSMGESDEAWRAVGRKCKDLNRNELEKLFEALLSLRKDIPKLAGRSRFHVSAEYLLGSSKSMDYLGDNLLLKLGIDCSLLVQGKRYLTVASPPDPLSVTMVENPQAFENAVAADTEQRHAWICSYGFGMVFNQPFGVMLANSFNKDAETVLLSRNRTTIPDLSALLSCPYIYFWGDLDLAGFDIYHRLKSHIHGLHLSPLYEPMHATLLAGKGHPYARISGKESQKRTGSPISVLTGRELEYYKSCQEYCIDQEAVTSEEIRKILSCMEMTMSLTRAQ